ncbi:MAG: tetratricopeptide repeat protein [Lachnospiraceae bacterium]|nr:tetratricopeptide repeat protein [Lachnospiraceae bacterium]MBR5356795.1 tetratricopeptide repeat protein [Lachnospiraceae bacterium]
MRCYNCGCELSEHSFCTNCGVDVALYKRIIRTSNFFYNQGLERAKVRDLSGAIVSLRQSLKFNKNNIKARNLLGLVYFELGEVPAALSEWVISKNLKSKKNIASDYLELVQSSAAKLDTINQSIKKYNQALEYAKATDGIDMAIIQLKRVLGSNPKFVRAHQLLALCYIQTRKLEYAKRELEKCKAIDVNNTMTLRYLSEVENMLNPVDDKKKGKNKDGSKEPLTSTYVDGNEVIIQPNYVKEKKGSNTVLNIIFGIAIGFAITFFLVVPAKVAQIKANSNEEIKSYGTQIESKNTMISTLEKTISEQEDKIATLTENLSAYAGTEGTLLSMENLLKASSIYLENPENYLEVADYIREVDESTWTEETSENYKRLYSALKNAIGPTVSTEYYNEGFNALKNGQFEDAIAYLEGSVFFNPSNVDAVYQLAVSYERAGKLEDAKTTYKKVTESYMGTWQAKQAETALAKLETPAE